VSTFYTNPNQNIGSSFSGFGRRKTAIQPGASGISPEQKPALNTTRFSLSYTFNGLTPGVNVVLLDNLFSVEQNDIWQAQIVRTGTVNKSGLITFNNLRDSIYSLVVLDIEHSDETIYDVSIGDPERFDTVAHHAIPSQPYIYQTLYEDTGVTSEASLFWRLGAGGCNGFPEIYYSISGENQWELFSRIQDTSVYSMVVGPLDYNTDYEFKVRLINEDFLPGPWSNITSVTTSDLAISGGEFILSGYYNESSIFKFDFENNDYYSTNKKYYIDNPGSLVKHNYGRFSYYATGNSRSAVSQSPLPLGPNYSYRFDGIINIDYYANSGVIGLFGYSGELAAYLQIDAGTTSISGIYFEYQNMSGIFTLDQQQGIKLGSDAYVSLLFDYHDPASLDVYLSILNTNGNFKFDQSITPVSGYSSFSTGIFGIGSVFNISGCVGILDEIELIQYYSDSPIKINPSPAESTIPSEGVFKSSFSHPSVNITPGFEESLDNKPTISLTKSTQGDKFFELTTSGLLFNPDEAVSGYALVTDSSGNASWKRVDAYSTALNTGLSVPTSVGGIESGTTVEDLAGLTVTQMFDRLLFPTVLPYISSNILGTLSEPNSPYNIREVGSNYVYSWNPVLLMYFSNGQIMHGDGTAGPPLVSGCHYVELLINEAPFFSSGFSEPVTGTIIEDNTIRTYTGIHFGANTFTTKFYYGAGTEPYYDNKGDRVYNLEGSRVSGYHTSTNYLYGRYYARYGMGEAGSAPTNSSEVRSLTASHTLSSSNTGSFSISIPANTEEVYFYTVSGKTITVNYVESSNADVTESFSSFGILVDDAGGNPVEYEGFVSSLGAGYPSAATYNVTIV